MINRRLSLIMLVVVIGLSGAISGCMQVIRHEAPYYEKGAGQVEGPDGFFEAGTHVWTFDENDSYMRVLSLGGVSAHVWSQDLTSVWKWRQIQKQSEKGDGDVKMFKTTK